ncbi:MAG TPA: hypothetical protein VK480_09955 [Solirubrobacterales bacterium]|nr:hypothetical protein [Solirubrobacterales bacterium]
MPKRLTKTMGVAALVAACAALSAAPAAPAQQAGSKCPDMTNRYVNHIRVKKVGCPQAKKVIVRYTEEIIDNLQHDWSLTVLGFHCDLTKKDYYGDSHRCTASGGREIRFRRGTDGPTPG